MSEPTNPTWTRRRFLAAVAAVAFGGLAVGAAIDKFALRLGRTGPRSSPGSTGGSLASALPGSPGAVDANQAGGRHRYRSRPDLTPPVITIQIGSGTPAPGLIFLTPSNGAGTDGPLIADNAGHPVWVRADTSGIGASTFHPIYYHGRPALVWWEGGNNNGIGIGEFVIVDPSYTEIGRVKAVAGSRADHHEFQLTSRGSALIFSDSGVVATRVVGSGPQPWQVLDCAIQEIDLATGALLFEWHSVDHIPLGESMVTPPTTSGVLHDYVHANSIEVDADGNLIMSARNTSTIYKIERTTGRVIWRLGGRASNFTMNPGASFSWQHDVRRHPDGSLSLLDDGAAPGTSRAIVLELDETAMTASLMRAYAHEPALLATSEGSVQLLPNGNVFVGWGSVSEFTEFSRDGRLILDGSFLASSASYRDLRYPWVGRPTEPPAIAVAANGTSLTVYASWNGATEVAEWQVLGGPSAATLGPVGSARRDGFETAITIERRGSILALRALDGNGHVLGTSAVLPVPA